MSQFVQNPVHFAADCVRPDGRCLVVRENFLFLNDGKELSAVDYLQSKCGHVVIIPDRSHKGKALLYHTSCQRMADVVNQIFPDCLEAPVRLPQAAPEMTVGELHRRSVAISYDDCRARIDDFDFPAAA
jgi:hypothetical protein